MVSQIPMLALTVQQLRGLLRERGLPISGRRTELILRLFEADRAESTMMSISPLYVAAMRERQAELSRRERRLQQRELQIVGTAREIQRSMREPQPPRFGQQVAQEVAAQPPRFGQQVAREVAAQPENSVIALAQLLSLFQGDSSEYDEWERRLKELERRHRLGEEDMKFIIRFRLGGKALEWMNTTPEHAQMSATELLSALRDKFRHRSRHRSRDGSRHRSNDGSRHRSRHGSRHRSPQQNQRTWANTESHRNPSDRQRITDSLVHSSHNYQYHVEGNTNPDRHDHRCEHASWDRRRPWF